MSLADQQQLITLEKLTQQINLLQENLDYLKKIVEEIKNKTNPIVF